MSTYCISDIHGNLGMFREMLKKIGFSYDGSDTLYILGDMVDWGRDSLDTLLYCKELDENYDFIHVLIGNHEYMMLECLTKGCRKGGSEYRCTDFDRSVYDRSDWALNRSLDTYLQFLDLEVAEQNELIDYLEQLPFFREIEVGGRKFYLTHSDCKPIALNEHEKAMFGNAEKFMIWNRVPVGTNRLTEVYGDKYRDVTLVHGHTIVDYYGSVDEDGNPAILFDDAGSSICIDCGCKGVGYSIFRHKCNSSLGCLRLDDLKTFYIREFR